MPRIRSCIIEMVIFRFEKGGPQYLLLHRQKNETLYPNIWQILSGSIEEGETATHAALRELGEETQLEPQLFWIAPYTTSFYDSKNDIMNLCPVFSVQVAAGSEPKLSEEHDAYRWLPFEEAVKLPVWYGQKEALRIVHEFIIGGKEAMKLNKLELSV